MSKIVIQDIIAACLLAVMVLYGSWAIFTEIFYTILPFGGFIAIGLSALFYFLRVPQPAIELVQTIVGKELHEAEFDDLTIKTVAHRGAGLDAPENSLAAFKLCHENGISMIEFDVTLTKDNVPVVFHDKSLERMANLTSVIANELWETLSSVDISVQHVYKDRFRNTNIPTLDQTVNQLLNCGQRMFIDIKDNNVKMVKVIHDLFTNQPELYSRAIVSTFYPNIIYLIRKGDPKIVCSMAYRPDFFAYSTYSYPSGKGCPRSEKWYTHYFLSTLDVFYAWIFPKLIHHVLGLSIILLHKDLISAKTIIEWRRRGVRVMAWSVNSPIEKQYLAKVLKISYLTDTFTGELSTHATTS